MAKFYSHQGKETLRGIHLTSEGPSDLRVIILCKELGGQARKQSYGKMEHEESPNDPDYSRNLVTQERRAKV